MLMDQAGEGAKSEIISDNGTEAAEKQMRSRTLSPPLAMDGSF